MGLRGRHRSASSIGARHPARRCPTPYGISCRWTSRSNWSRARCSSGSLTGLWIALLFATPPAARPPPRVAAAGAATPRRDRTRRERRLARAAIPQSWAAGAAIAATVLGIAMSRAPTTADRLRRRPRASPSSWASCGSPPVPSRRWPGALPRARWPYVLRQGIANLHRPANQTRAVVLALGLWRFLISTLYSGAVGAAPRVRRDDGRRRARISCSSTCRMTRCRPPIPSCARPDIPVVEQTPIVTMRIAAINGVPVSAAAVDRGDAADTTDTADTPQTGAAQRRGNRRSGGPRRAAWALRREYRSTYRDTSSRRNGSSRAAGRGHAHGGRLACPACRSRATSPRSSALTIGDRVTWDVQGVPVAVADHEPSRCGLGELRAQFLRRVPGRRAGARAEAIRVARRRPHRGRHGRRCSATSANAIPTSRASISRSSATRSTGYSRRSRSRSGFSPCSACSWGFRSCSAPSPPRAANVSARACCSRPWAHRAPR